MKQLLVIILLFAVAGSSCKKENNPQVQLTGTYTGTFQRRVAGQGVLSNVTLNFSAGSWTGQSQIVKYPALNNGTFSISGSKVTFQNASAWTAEFDWSLILNGEYDIKASGKNLQISKTYPGETMDVYTLTQN